MTDALETIALEVAAETGGITTVYDLVPQKWIIDYAKALIERLTRDAEPVAWRFKDIRGVVHLVESSEIPSFAQHTIEPLFLHPPLTQRSVPEGWVLVPKEPTKKMLRAALDRPMSSGVGGVWKAMIAAAPKPEELK